jgi:hypothetical protein
MTVLDDLWHISSLTFADYLKRQKELEMSMTLNSNALVFAPCKSKVLVCGVVELNFHPKQGWQHWWQGDRLDDV